MKIENEIFHILWIKCGKLCGKNVEKWKTQNKIVENLWKMIHKDFP